MPLISTFYGMVIQMYWREHPPPHFHVRYAGVSATFDIATATVLEGSLPKTAERR